MFLSQNLTFSSSHVPPPLPSFSTLRNVHNPLGIRYDMWELTTLWRSKCEQLYLTPENDVKDKCSLNLTGHPTVFEVYTVKTW